MGGSGGKVTLYLLYFCGLVGEVTLNYLFRGCFFFFKLFGVFLCVGILFLVINIHSFIPTIFFCIFGGSVSVGQCAFCFWATASISINCFGKIRVALKRAGWCNLMQAHLLIWADSAGWTGWEVLTVLDEWKMALVTLLVEVERVKMVVVCQSAGTVVHLESHQRGLTIQKCCVDFPLVFQMHQKAG